MGLKNLLALAVVTAVVALATSAVLGPHFSKVNSVHDDLPQKLPYNHLQAYDPIYLSGDDDDYYGAEDFIDPSTKLDGIVLKDLTPEELYLLLEDDDNMVVAELDIVVLKNKVLDRTSTQAEAVAKDEDDNNNNSDHNSDEEEGVVVQRKRLEQEEEGEKGEGEGEEAVVRRKRWGLVARAAARALFGGASRGRLTTSGSRLTRQYTRRGSFNDAVRDFNRFNPSRQSSFNGRISGRTGQVGNHRITVRDGSSGGRPTLEIRSPRPDGSTYVRKFRYQQ